MRMSDFWHLLVTEFFINLSLLQSTAKLGFMFAKLVIKLQSQEFWEKQKKKTQFGIQQLYWIVLQNVRRDFWMDVKLLLWLQQNSLSTLQAVMSAFEFLQKLFKASLFSAGK